MTGALFVENPARWRAERPTKKSPAGAGLRIKGGRRSLLARPSEAIAARCIDVRNALVAALSRTRGRVPLPPARACLGIRLSRNAIGRWTRAGCVGGSGRSPVGLTSRSTVGSPGIAWSGALLMRLPPRGLGNRSTELPLQNTHRCFIGKPRKPCCGREIKAALVVLTGRHSQQQIACLPVVPIGKLAQKRDVVVCHLSVRPRRSVRFADCRGPEECASDLHSRCICSSS
jgi:hypothetical protein